MSDDADRADKTIEDVIQMGLARARLAATQPKQYYYECKWCGDPTIEGARYCSKECSADHYRYLSTLKRNGIEP